MRIDFRSRGHFCNYCRKILFNKIYDKAKSLPQGYPIININEVMWYVWNNDDLKKEEFILDLSHLEVKDTAKEFNKLLRALKAKWMKVRS